MNKVFSSILIVFALLLIFGSVSFDIYDKKIFIPNWAVYPVTLVSILFLVWKIIEIRDEKLHNMILKFRKYIRYYLEKRSANKSHNLLVEFPEKIRGNKDLYYVDK